MPGDLPDVCPGEEIQGLREHRLEIIGVFFIRERFRREFQSAIPAPELEQVLKEALPGVAELELNFAGLEYISSAGLRVLLSAQKTMDKQGKMKITHADEMIMEIFEVTGFQDILTIE